MSDYQRWLDGEIGDLDLARSRDRYQRGWADCEARIIKLLLEHPICVDVDGSTYCDCSNETIEVSYKDHLLALIKGKAE